MIKVNRKHSLEWRADLSIADVLALLRYSFPHIVVSINGVLVQHDAYAETLVPDDADVQVIHLTAGG